MEKISVQKKTVTLVFALSLVSFFSFSAKADQSTARLSAIEKRIKAEESYLQAHSEDKDSREYRDHAKGLEFWQKQKEKVTEASSISTQRASAILAQEEIIREKAREKDDQEYKKIRTEREAFEKNHPKAAARAAEKANPEMTPERLQKALQQAEKDFEKNGPLVLGPRDGFIDGVAVGPAAAQRTREEAAAIRAEIEEVQKRHDERVIQIADREKEITALKAKIKSDKERAERERKDFDETMRKAQESQKRIQDLIKKTDDLGKKVQEQQAALETWGKDFNNKKDDLLEAMRNVVKVDEKLIQIISKKKELLVKERDQAIAIKDARQSDSLLKPEAGSTESSTARAAETTSQTAQSGAAN